MNNTLNLAIKQAARRLSVDQQLVESVYKSYWMFVRSHLSSLSYDSIIQKDLGSTVTNFNIPYIGKLYMDDEKIDKYKRHLNYLEHVKSKEH